MKKQIFCCNILSIACILIGIMLSGCATTPPQSGFLKDYSILKQDPQDESLLWWEKKGINWQRYKKLIIDPVVIYLHPEAKNRQIEPDVMKELVDYFRNTVIEEVRDSFPVVNESGHDVLRIRAAITDLIPVNPLINAVAIVGVGLPVDMGGAAMEAEFLDSTTGELLGAVVDKKLGVPVHPGDIIAGFTTWGHAKSVLDAWAALLLEALEYTEEE